MKVVILNAQVPFVYGGAEYLADSLKTKLEGRGHEVENVRIPFNWTPPDNILQHMLACRLLRIDPVEPDLVIALKFPVYLIPFARKKLWLLHQFRQVYELWGTPYQDLPDTPEGWRVRDAIIDADNRYLPEAQAIYTNSRIVANRLRRYNGLSADAVLYPPLLDGEVFVSGEAQDYFFYPSRVVASKRQHVAIEAMRYTRSPFRLVIAGRPETPDYDAQLRGLIETHRLQDKVTLLGYITDEEKIRLMANAYAAIYIPYDEDSYGYVTLEAFHAHKPVLTFTDSGGTDEVIEHEGNGLILDPTPQALAEGMEWLWSRRPRARAMGEAAHRTLSQHNIRWDYVLDTLLS